MSFPKLCAGRICGRDLLPIKPFIYSQVYKPSNFATSIALRYPFKIKQISDTNIRHNTQWQNLSQQSSGHKWPRKSEDVSFCTYFLQYCRTAAYSRSKALIYKKIPVQQPGPDEVLIHIKYSGVCHTDLHALHGDWPLETKKPLVGGHEGAGIVVALGSLIEDIEIGDYAGVKVNEKILFDNFKKT